MVSDGTYETEDYLVVIVKDDDVRLMQPVRGAEEVIDEVYFSWESDLQGDPLTYSLYLGTSSDPPLYQADLTVSNATVSDLARNTTFYWRVVAFNGSTELASSELRSFSTGGATKADLAWLFPMTEGDQWRWDVMSTRYHTSDLQPDTSYTVDSCEVSSSDTTLTYTPAFRYEGGPLGDRWVAVLNDGIHWSSDGVAWQPLAPLEGYPQPVGTRLSEGYTVVDDDSTLVIGGISYQQCYVVSYFSSYSGNVTMNRWETWIFSAGVGVLKHTFKSETISTVPQRSQESGRCERSVSRFP